MATPKIRLKGFEGEWKESLLKDFFTKCSEKNSKKEYCAVFTNSAEHGIIDQKNFFDHDIANIDNINVYYIVKPNDFVYNPRVSVTAPVGPINFNQLGYTGVISPLYLVFSIDGINKSFLNLYYKTPKWHNFMKISGNCGARFDRLSISDDDFVKMPIIHPDESEQSAIASYFHSLDNLIQTTAKKIESLKQMKAASLISMFPQEGETAPKVRFKGYEGEWKKMKLKKCLDVCKERNFFDIYNRNDVLSVSDDFGVVNQIKLLGRSFAGKSVSNYRVLKKNNIVYTKSPLKSKPFGIIKVNEGEDGIVSTLYAVYTAKSWVSPQYINYYFEPSYRMNKYIHPLVNKGAKNDMKVSDENVLNGFIKIPFEKKEQEAIANYFVKLDTQISLQSQRLEKLKNIKAECLNKMFV